MDLLGRLIDDCISSRPSSRDSLNTNFFGDVCNIVKKELRSTRIGQSSMTNLGPISTVRGRETSNGMGTFSIHLQIRQAEGGLGKPSVLTIWICLYGLSVYGLSAENLVLSNSRIILLADVCNVFFEHSGRSVF
ncbi:hypothetical protein AVEN_126828-1 [Araneus ventricosus]|uniref:Uncharacterized protein n=1 Tax=Araneus ventricosus TaxID=182803 RepID=A0A4Y2HTC4_ARAVE|nr:hypothetical protein AVEN_126828-1 [Araneus ventricosus]